MTTRELEVALETLKIKVRVLEHVLTQHDSLPILGPGGNWKNYQRTLDLALAAAGLQSPQQCNNRPSDQLP